MANVSKELKWLERHRFPLVASGIERPAARINIKEEFLALATDVLGLIHDVVQVGVEDEILVGLPDPECEAALLVGEGTPREGTGPALHDHVLPLDSNAVKDVVHAVVFGEAESGGAGVEGATKGEAAGGGADEGAEVELDVVVELIGVRTVDLDDVVGAVGGETVEGPVQELEGGEPELRWEHHLHEALAKGQQLQERGQRCPEPLHFRLSV